MLNSRPLPQEAISEYLWSTLTPILSILSDQFSMTLNPTTVIVIVASMNYLTVSCRHHGILILNSST
jgi:hypothetical protein